MSEVKSLVINCFIETMEEMDNAIIHSIEYDIKSLLNSENSILSIAAKFGDVVPITYLELIEQSLFDLIPGYNREFTEYYYDAVNKYKAENTELLLIDSLLLSSTSLNQLEKNCTFS